MTLRSLVFGVLIAGPLILGIAGLLTDDATAFPAVLVGVTVAVAIIWLWALALVRGRQQRVLRELDAAFRARRYAEVVERSARSLQRWPTWSHPLAYLTSAQIALWRLDAVLSFYENTWRARPNAEAKRYVLERALFVSELLGIPGEWRARAEQTRLPLHAVRLAELVRAARARDFDRVRQLSSQLDAKNIPEALSPLVDAIRAMAAEATPQPIDKITLLGETGLEQVEKIWPELADFIRRAPAR